MRTATYATTISSRRVPSLVITLQGKRRYGPGMGSWWKMTCFLVQTLFLPTIFTFLPH